MLKILEAFEIQFITNGVFNWIIYSRDNKVVREKE